MSSFIQKFSLQISKTIKNDLGKNIKKNYDEKDTHIIFVRQKHKKRKRCSFLLISNNTINFVCTF